MILQVAAVAVSLIIIVMGISNGKKKVKIPPGPRGLPFIGNLLEQYWQRSEPHIYLRNLSLKYGPLATLHHGSTPVLVVSSMKMANHILKSHDQSFCSRPSVLGQQKLSYSGLDIAFSPFNHHWKQMRKLCALHLLSPKQVLSFRPTREDEVSRMISNIRSSGLGRPLNLSQVAMSLASNLITSVAFGRRYDGDEFEKKRLDRLVMEAQALMVSFYFSDHFPALSWVDKASGLLGRLHRSCVEMDAFYKELIDDHLLPSKPDRQDMIDLMIQLKDDNTFMSHDWDDRIKALLMDLYVAGTDTVAAAIVWTMTALMLKPTVMNKAQAEIRGLEEKKGRCAVGEDDIKELPYLKAVVLEALRLYPPAPLLYRTTQECTRVEGYDIEAGTQVIINGWAIGRDPESWEKAEEFEPERFMTSERDAFEMMLPFGGGRRGCPGKEMGLISVHLALANLLYSFDWALPEDHLIIDTHTLPGLTMHKKNPLLILPTNYHASISASPVAVRPVPVPT
ncbi:hypothetical protein ACS0TY_017729 [Phlomoides rotata]